MKYNSYTQSPKRHHFPKVLYMSRDPTQLDMIHMFTFQEKNFPMLLKKPPPLLLPPEKSVYSVSRLS